MAFLDAFGPAHRALFESAAVAVSLSRGEYLLRRGEPGGDVFLLVEGTLDVVDSRSTPELILSTLQPGAMVGEIAFIDDSPRSADVRAGSTASVLRWGREDLRSLLAKHPDLAAVFFEQVAKLASGRIRFLTEGAVAGAFSEDPEGVADADEVHGWVARVVGTLKEQLLPVETALRRDPDDPEAHARLRAALDHLEVEVDALFAAHRDPGAGRYAAEQLGRELHPWLVRSSLVDRCLRRSPGVVGTAEALAYVLVDAAGGDGRLGELLDRWLLDRPTFAALRGEQAPLVDKVRALLPSHRNRRVLLINAGTGSIVARLVEALEHPPTVLTVVDQSREMLSLLDVERTATARGVELVTVQENLVRFATGRAGVDLPGQDAVILHGLVEYLPERLAVGMLTVARSLLSQEGFVALANIGPSRDRTLIDRLLGWPTIRRTSEGVDELLRAARLDVAARVPVPEPGMLLVAVPDEQTVIKPRLPSDVAASTLRHRPEESP